MTTNNETWTGNRVLSKAEIERMYRIAYTVDPSFYKMQDMIYFGLDVPRLKEFGDVVMKKGLPTLRKGVNELWNRMDDHQKSAYLMGNVIEGLRGVALVLQDLEKMIGPMPDAHEGLEMAQNGLYAKIPKALRERLDNGFGKWRSKKTT